MNSSDKTDARAARTLGRSDARAVLAQEAAFSFQPPPDSAPEIDPFAQWLNLMEVVQMLCPAWPVREQPMQGDHWRL